MEITIDGIKIPYWNECSVRLTFNSVADTFSFKMLYDPANPVHKRIFRPLSYLPCTITHGGVLVLTGVVLNHTFLSAGDPPLQLVQVDGYSTTGVLDDTCVLYTDAQSPVVYPNSDTVVIAQASLQTNGLTLEQIAKLACGYYGIGVVVDQDLYNDSATAAALKTPYGDMRPEPDETVTEYLARLCKGKNIVLSHTNEGKLLLTRAKVDKLLTTTRTFVIEKPVSRSDDIEGAPTFTASKTTVTTTDRAVLFDFTIDRERIKKWTSMSLQVNGQNMHRLIQVVGQSGSENASDSGKANPLVAVGTERFVRYIQRATSNDNETPLTARFYLNKELRGIQLKIEIEGWALGGNLVTPNQIITVTNPELFLFEKTKFFITEVSLSGDETKEVSTLTCHIPEAFGNDDTIVNIFA